MACDDDGVLIENRNKRWQSAKTTHHAIRDIIASVFDQETDPRAAFASEEWGFRLVWQWIRMPSFHLDV
jgi:hypothetical protein